MLILTRKLGEAVEIGDEVRVIVCGISVEGQVRLGIEAPRAVTIRRSDRRPRTTEG